MIAASNRKKKFLRPGALLFLALPVLAAAANRPAFGQWLSAAAATGSSNVQARGIKSNVIPFEFTHNGSGVIAVFHVSGTPEVHAANSTGARFQSVEYMAARQAAIDAACWLLYD